VAAERVSRRELLRWVAWFGAINAGLFGLIALRYLWYYRFPDDFIGIVYVILAFAGQFAVLACIPLFLVTVPIVLVAPVRKLVMFVAVLISASGLSLLFLDTNVFAEHRFHLSFLIVAIFEGPTWIFVGVLFLIFVIFESLLAGIVWRNLAARPGAIGGAWVAVTLILAWLGGQAMHIWGDAVAYTPVTQFTRFMPLYYPIHAKRALARRGWVDPEQVQKRRMLQGSMAQRSGQLSYPLAPMDCGRGDARMPNLLVVLIDALRPDALHPELTPNLVAFRDSGIHFSQQYSGGNSSRMGIFSLFYGLPSTYWQTFYDLQQAPVLMDQIKAREYQRALYSAVGFGSPTLIDRTVFAGWADLPVRANDLSPLERNRAVTDDWLDWLTRRDVEKPFFGFVYYDPPIISMPATGPDALPMDERFTTNPDARALWRQYRLAIRFVDGEVGRIMASLEQRQLFDDTIVIVVSDHGYEFDDNGLGYVGHASNFSPAQLRATLMMHWPGKPPVEIAYRTSHHDLPVTLLQDVFDCRNPAREYSMGRNLFSGEPWAWMMAGSYTDHAIVEPGQVIVSHPGGFVEIRDRDYRPVNDSSLDTALIQESLEAQRRFFR